MIKGLPASLINFSLTSAAQSLHVFTATLTLSPVCTTMAYLFTGLHPAHTAFKTFIMNSLECQRSMYSDAELTAGAASKSRLYIYHLYNYMFYI